MKHKSIINLIASFFCLGIIFAIVSIFLGYTARPEIIFIAFFTSLILTCILFFMAADYLDKKHKENNLTNVINQDLYIFKNM